MDKIFVVPFGEDIIKKVAELIANKGLKREFKDIFVVFPGKRPGLYLVKYLSKLTGGIIIPPRRFSMVEFLRWIVSKSGLFLRDPKKLELSIILYKVIKNLEKKDKRDFGRITESFDRFLPWAGYILNAIEEMNREDVGSFFTDYTSDDVPVDARVLWESMDKIRDEFLKSLKERRIAGAGIEWIEAKRLIEKGMQFDEFKDIYFVGLYSLTKTESFILKYFLKNYNAQIFIQTDAEKLKKKPPICSPYYHHYRMLKELSADIFCLSETTLSSPIVHMYEGYNLHSEVKKIGEIMQEITPHDSSLCIALPDETSLPPLIHEVIAPTKEKFNLTMGYPLKITPLFGLVKAVCDAQRFSEEGSYHYSLYLDVIKHPYVKSISRNLRKLIYEIENYLTKHDVVYVDLKEVEKNIKEDIKLLHDRFFRDFENISDISILSDRFESLLSWIAQNSGFFKTPVEGEYLYRLFLILDEIKETGRKEEIFKERLSNPKALYTIFTDIIENEKIPFEGEPLKGIQVMGMLETRTLKFSKVIVPDVNEGLLPGAEKENPFLPYRVRKLLGLPTNEDRESVYAYNFYRLIRSAEEVWLFYRSGETYEKKASRSRFIEQMLWEEEKVKGVSMEEAKIEKIGINLKPSPVVFGDFVIEKDEETLKKLEGLEFSPKSFITYLRCPLEFYFSYILGLKPPEEVEEPIKGLWMGNFIHEILKEIYERKEILTSFETSPRKFLSYALKEAYRVVDEKFFSSQRFLKKQLKGFTLLTRNTVRAFLVYFFKQEIERMKKGRIKVVMVEKPFSKKIKIDGKEISLIGKIDRVDEVEGREYLIIDYKTGRINLRRQLDRFFKKDSFLSPEWSATLQLYFYLYLFDKVGIEDKNAAIYDLKNLKIQYLFDKGKNQKSQQFSTFTNILFKTLREILNSSKPFYKSSRKTECEKCIYRTVCESAESS